jgi:hypothetical protein
MRSRLLPSIGPVLVAGALLASTQVPAVAGSGSPKAIRSFEVRGLKAISGATPFPDGCPGAANDDAHIPGYETEPSITVNPRRPRRIVASWMQDPGPGVAARSTPIAWSRNRGRTWRRTTIPGLTVCTGGAADAAGDPWLSTGADGTAYFTGVAASFSPEGRIAEIVASHSNDRGRSWASVVTVAPPDLRNDKPAITADPRVPGRAYTIWANWDMQFNFPFANLLQFARTDDNGATWSEPVVIDAPPPNAVDLSSAVLVLPDGSLLAVFERIEIALDLTATELFFATRSVDGGDTWSPLVEIGSMPIVSLSDPETGEPLPQPGFLSAAAGHDGNVYVVWEHQSSPTSATIDVARSHDGGLTWSVAPLPGVSAFAFEPSVAVDSHGTVGVTWYDLRNDVPGDAALTADYWFAHSDDTGASWRQTHVAGPTDLRTAPLAAHNRVGEYQGLAALRAGFAAAFTLATPQAKHGPTDIFFARIVPSERDDDD